MSFAIDLVETNAVGAAGMEGAPANVTDFSLCLPATVFSLTEKTTKFKSALKSAKLSVVYTLPMIQLW